MHNESPLYKVATAREIIATTKSLLVYMHGRLLSCPALTVFLSYDRVSAHIMMSLARGKVSEAAARLTLAEGMLQVQEYVY